MDPRVERAQALLWEAEELERRGAVRAARAVRAKLGRVHRDIALERLDEGEPDGWIDLYAAVTALGEAGEKLRAESLLDRGSRLASDLGVEARANVERELQAHRRWLRDLVVLPSLSELAAPRPPPPKNPSAA